MDDPIVGRVLEGRYRIVQRLARGGMSTVYAALDERLDRDVAVKVMSSALSTDPAFADRFSREARVAARLSHPNAVSVYDQGTDGSHVFLVMELVRGRTLRDLLRERGVLNPAQALSIMEPVLGALAAAHRAGLVHRDVKPENILLSDDGAVKVADFGLARAVESDASSTRTGLMMGTVAYCPPEQIARGAADARSDVYSAGIVLFELLTGSAPFVGDSAMAVAYQHVNSDVPPPSRRRPGIPPQLDEVVLRATRREPSGRPLDAGALLAELHDVRIDLGLPVVAVPPRPRPNHDLDATQVFAPVSDRRNSTAPRTGIPSGFRPEEPTTPTHAARGLDPTQRTAVSDRPVQAAAAAAAASKAGKPAKGDKAPKAGRPSSRRRRARRRTAIVVIIIVLLGLLTGYGTWWLTVGRYRQVPDVSGMTQSVAIQKLRADGFTINSAVNQQYSEDVKSGQIIGTDPEASAHLIKGKQITLIVSRGAERYKVPSVLNKPLTDAKHALELVIPDAQLIPSSLADPTGQVAQGLVLRTDPPTGAQVKRGQVITVYVSSGPPVIAVPDVTGRTRADAQQALSKAGFKPTFTEDFSDDVDQGDVISTSPAAKASAVKFTTISVVISKGKAIVTIPNIASGDDPDQAKSALEGLGLVVVVSKKSKAFLDFSSYKVDRVEPGPGTQVRRGSTVILRVK